MSKIRVMRDLLFELLQEHRRDGTIPTNARFLFYQLVQRGQLSKEQTSGRRPDQDLHDALTDIREDGRTPWDWIVDETRSVEDYTGYVSIKAGVLAQLPYITLDPWRGRSPLNLTESRSLAGVLRGTAREYRTRIAATNGQCGGFLRTDIAPLLRPGAAVHYFGDLIEDNTRRVFFEREVGSFYHQQSSRYSQGKQCRDRNRRPTAQCHRSTHRSPRLHFRRRHWRHFVNHKTWIKWTLVGDPDLGFIDKDYRL
jgi:hypothetical protein